MKYAEHPKDLAIRAIYEELAIASDNIIKSYSLTKKPVLFLDSFPDGRKDFQITYIWAVRLNKKFKEFRLVLEKETLKVMPISLTDLKQWITKSPSDFCHSHLLDLLNTGLNELLREEMQD